ncbi:uncharacterized protein OCT59_023079 [Rhizophagus irregularis]|uniref:uncharacterized protein n=1 Tax=Rhizophagus irregularis TaxID=588596 RepID=UPI00331971F1|nr:hypothetical protein OCT59_023079 [Rhizophagus irregularis]
MTVDSGADHSTIAITRQAPRNYSVALLDDQAEWVETHDLTSPERVDQHKMFDEDIDAEKEKAFNEFTKLSWTERRGLDYL